MAGQQILNQLKLDTIKANRGLQQENESDLYWSSGNKFNEKRNPLLGKFIGKFQDTLKYEGDVQKDKRTKVDQLIKHMDRSKESYKKNVRKIIDDGHFSSVTYNKAKNKAKDQEL